MCRVEPILYHCIALKTDTIHSLTNTRTSENRIKKTSLAGKKQKLYNKYGQFSFIKRYAMAYNKRNAAPSTSYQSCNAHESSCMAQIAIMRFNGHTHTHVTIFQALHMLKRTRVKAQQNELEISPSHWLRCIQRTPSINVASYYAYVSYFLLLMHWFGFLIETSPR